MLNLIRFLVKLSHESIIVELKTGAIVQGTVSGVENNMNMHLKNVKFTSKGRSEKSVDSMTIRGHSIRYVILPEQLALDNLLVDDTPKQGQGRPKGRSNRRTRTGRGRGRGRRGRGRGRGRGRRRNY